MRIATTPNRFRLQAIVALWSLLAAGLAVGQQASPPAEHKHRSIQQSPGEGDTGDSEGMDEAADARPHEGPYQSPYKPTFKVPLHELLFDVNQERGNATEQSSLPHREWYSGKVRAEFGSWGAPARAFDCPPGVHEKPVEWRRERVVAAAMRFIGYEYQHHHIPDWNPPADWPWQHCCAGKNGKGVDCSNFSGWNYNWGLGIHLNTDIHRQAAQTTAKSTHGELHAQVIARPEGAAGEWYQTLVHALRPGDLLYIGNKSRTKVTHVIMWVGDCASSPDGTPLVIDSTGGRIKDSSGHAIPCGIHLRPFGKGSWYHHSFHHAHRWVR